MYVERYVFIELKEFCFLMIIIFSAILTVTVCWKLFFAIIERFDRSRISIYNLFYKDKRSSFSEILSKNCFNKCWLFCWNEQSHFPTLVRFQFMTKNKENDLYDCFDILLCIARQYLKYEFINLYTCTKKFGIRPNKIYLTRDSTITNQI